MAYAALTGIFTEPPDRAAAGRWSGLALHLLVAAGAVTVILGSAMTWATFYGGLIERDGMAGHGRFFVGAACASVLAALLAGRGGVSRTLRWLPMLFGVAIAGWAYRDLRNLHALIEDPASGFYLPGRGPGLTVVIAGAAMLVAAPLAVRAAHAARAHLLPTLASLAAVGAVALAVPGAYGIYYDVTNDNTIASDAYGRDAQLLLGAGVVLALAAIWLAAVSAMRPLRQIQRQTHSAVEAEQQGRGRAAAGSRTTGAPAREAYARPD
jgi:hypothetical protein